MLGNGTRGSERGASGDVAVARDAECDGGAASLDCIVDLCEFVFGCGETDAEPFGFADPAFAFSFGDAGGKVVADVDQTVLLVGVDPQQWAADAAVFMDAACSVCSSAVAEGEATALEMSEEFVPFRVGGASVFFAWPQGAAAGYEGAVTVDGFLGIDGLVAHGGVDVLVPQ
jgi:hypothetical protein